jgi:hypothetical protein
MPPLAYVSRTISPSTLFKNLSRGAWEVYGRKVSPHPGRKGRGWPQLAEVLATLVPALLTTASSAM